MTKTARQGIQSIEVGGRLLHALVEHGRPMMLRDLAAAAAMPASKAHRYLVSLARMGLIEQDAGSAQYDLGPFSLQLGLASLERQDAVKAAMPALSALCRDINETVALAVWGNHGPTVIRWEESSRPITMNLRTGSVLPLLSSATGLAFAAFLPPAFTAVLRKQELAAAKKAGTAIDEAELDRSLAAVRRHGVARALGDLLPGVNALSVPVYDHSGMMVLAISALGHAGLFNAAWDSPIASALKAAAAEVSRRLGYRGAVAAIAKGSKSA